jgi:DNA repair exonuclease SbcCD ATPase subunit
LLSQPAVAPDESALSQLQTDLATAQQQAIRLEQELVTTRQGEVALKQELLATRASEQALKSELSEIQAQLKAQQTELQKLQKQQQQTQSLKDELAAAKKMILQLSAQNTVKNPGVQDPGATKLQTAPPPAEATKPALSAELAKPKPEPAAQAYRFERIGWKPLSNHLIQPEPHSTKLTDSDIGWVD